MNLNKTMGIIAFLGIVISLSVNGATYEGRLVTKALERSGKDLKGVELLKVSLSAKVFRVTTETRLVKEVVFDCEDDLEGDGSRGDWYGFFEAKKEDKPARLAAAIKGVGLSTAYDLIEDGYFDSKPRSWREFKRRINRADDDYETGFSYDVLVEFKKDNMIDLGYLIEGQCGYKVEMVLKRVPVRTYHRTETRDYVLRIANAPLLTGERESFSVSFDGFDDSIIVNSHFNDYEVVREEHNDTVVFELSGNRKTVRPNNTLNVTATDSSGMIQLRVTNASFDADIARDAKIFVVGKVYHDRSGWKSDLHLGDFKEPLSVSSSTTMLSDIGISVPEDGHIIVHYRIQYEGSRYYSSDSSSNKKLKKSL